ncbi:MAG TPA: oxaloacetate decarboxylase [Candidatus Acidoferrum sp.]|jgi:2-methylisocitrate lyase-like PEP mutase family enzyme|nr:oxaloacetate decarboxylase [Candidatus Acidoferrum sp.]
MRPNLAKTLRAKILERRGLLVPGAANALAARVVEDLGFEALYLSGAGLTNSLWGMPDLGFITLSELAQHTAAIRQAVNLPLIVDADTGFGNAVNVWHCVRVLERAGADAIQIEDQIMPKKCGHFANKSVIPAEEMVGKIKAAVDARVCEDFVTIARTDALAVEGFEAAIQRAQRYIQAGADVTFVEAPEDIDLMRDIPRRLSVPQIVNVVVGGKTPVLAQKELAAMGFGLVLYANVALQGAIAGMQQALGDLKDNGRVDKTNPQVASFEERQRLVKKSFYEQLDNKYSGKS